MNIVNKQINVVSVLDRAGIVKPEYFSIIQEGNVGEWIAVNRLIRRDREKIGGRSIYTFTCEIDDEGKKVLCDLRYDIEGDEWLLYRI
jgi:hypothetical protein